MFFWVVTPCNLVSGDKRFERRFCNHLQDGGNMVFRNFGIDLQDHTASKARTPLSDIYCMELISHVRSHILTAIDNVFHFDRLD
jgi:hypothetical protein